MNTVLRLDFGVLLRLAPLVLMASLPLKAAERPRLAVLTDIGGDPDDQQSLVRLMVYANQFEIEALIASASGTRGELKQAVTRPDLVRQIIRAYGQVRPNLLRHATGWPTEEQLLRCVKSGNPQRGDKHIGEGHDTEGSRFLVERIDAGSPQRPLNIAIWGGQTDLAQALWHVKHARDDRGFREFAAKFRVFDISDQDGIADWMRAEFPGMHYILAKAPPGRDKREGTYRGMYLGGDESLTSREWVERHVSRTGPLGALYPTKTWTAPNTHGCLKEGDTPSWLFFLPLGGNDPADPAKPGWGGQYERQPDGWYRDLPAKPGFDPRETVSRWRPDFQRDFARRMAWCRHDTALSAEVVSTPGPIWKRHTIDDTCKGADGVKLGDINGDGLQDIVTGWEEGGEVRLYLNPGPDRARQAWPHVTVGKVANVEEAILADLDGDGRLDVVSGTEGKTRTLYWHRFSGNNTEILISGHWSTVAFPATRGSQSWMQAAALDLDGQYGLDLMLGSKNAGATVGWLQSPSAPLDLAGWRFHPLREAGWVMSLIPHDMDDDGDLDVVISDRKGPRTGVFWLENPGAEANRRHAPWQEHAIGVLGRQVMFADVADVNGDGLADAAVAVKPVEIVLCMQEARGAWRETTLRLHSENLGDAKAVKVADLNGDGLPDLVFTCENAKGQREGVVWLEQQRQGPWLQRSLGGPEGLKYDLLQVLDLDGDGDLDVITCEERDQLGVIWYENPLGRPLTDSLAVSGGRCYPRSSNH